MKYETRTINADRGIVQITTTDERWYSKVLEDKSTIYVPSVTWIAGFYPKGIHFYKWLAEKGWDESQAIKQAAGYKGSKVHKAAEDILSGKVVKMDDQYVNPTTGESEELTVQEYECLMSLVDWLNATKPEILSTEYNIFNQEEGYAGTVDIKCKINGEVWIVDLKTGQSIWPEYHLQVSAYLNADREATKVGILQIGYQKNKNQKYKFTEIEPRYDLFLAAKKIWAYETENQKPSQKDYPLLLKWEPPKETMAVKPAKKKVVRKIKVVKKKK